MSLIETQHPDLAGEVALARLAFGNRFPQAEERLRGHVSALLANHFADFDRKLRSELSDRIDTIDRNAAAAFLVEVQHRDQDTIPATFLKPLLLGVYDNPVAEMAAGFVQEYRTDGSGKALGLELVLETPLSFAAKDGRRPHILRQWTSLDGRGKTYINLGVMDLGEPVREFDLRSSHSTALMQHIIGAGNRLLEHGFIIHEGYPGMWSTSVRFIERSGIHFAVATFVVQIYIEDRVVSLNCGGLLTIENQDEADALALERVEPLCRVVLNSLIPLDAYR